MMWDDGEKPGTRKPYKPEPEKNRVFTPEEAAAIKRRRVAARRAIEDERIDRELGLIDS